MRFFMDLSRPGFEFFLVFLTWLNTETAETRTAFQGDEFKFSAHPQTLTRCSPQQAAPALKITENS